MNKGKKIAAVVLATCMATSAAVAMAACKDDKVTSGDTYTYRSATTSLATNWNPHTWETNADSALLSYVSSPFVDMSILNSEEMTYQWVYEMATSVEDVTAEHQDDLTKYGVTLQDGKTAATTTEGFVYEIGLNPDAAWENGEAITADDYIYSMQQLLDPMMKNYRANLYVAGESALAGAYNYYYSKTPIFDPVVPAYGAEDTPDYSFDIDSQPVFINLRAENMTIAAYSFQTIKDDYGYIRNETDEEGNVTVPGADYYDELSEEANPYGYIEVTDENEEKVLVIMNQYLAAFGLSIYNEDGSMNKELFMEFLFYDTGEISDEVSYDTVGCYKVDDYTIRYVNQTYINRDYFMTSLTSTWLVYEDLYEAGKDTTGELVTTNYGTSKETTMSYGAYKFDSIDTGRQMRLSQNEHWYGWEEETDENGNTKLVSYTNFEVDGEKRKQYETTNIVIDVMDVATMEQAFMRGELSEWSPQADQMSQYATSDYLYQVDETYTMSFFFNTNLDDLKEMDRVGTNTNGVVVSNTNFRKAMSLAINREELVTATQGYKPAYSLMNELYYYNVYEDPTSIYRHTDEAMQAICSLYGVEYGEGTPYATLEEAYNSINGYNLTEAQALMKQACEELVAAGLYTAGEPIEIAIAWKQGAINSDDNAQVALLNRYINAAVEGSGFGTVTFSIVGNMKDPDNYEAVPQGLYAIGQGAWGGAAFYPFRNFQVYMDPDQYSINEDACWDPTTETLTLTIDGVEETMTWQEWSNCMTGSAKYAAASNETKLQITALLEEAYLKLYYRIPLMSTTVCSLLSQQVEYYTQTYNIMYGFGGLRLMTYTYNDSDWAKYVADQGGTLNYE